MTEPGGCFGPAAARLAGQTAMLIGWHPDQFWAATPAELASVFAAALPPAGEGVSRQTLNALLERDSHG